MSHPDAQSSQRKASSIVTTAQDPYAMCLPDAEYYEIGYSPLDEVLTPAGVALLALAGRHLARVAYQDAIECGDRRFARRSAKVKSRLLAQLPAACDSEGLRFRLAWARAFSDLADDLDAGLAPLPRCTGERHALEVMIERAPALLALDDGNLIASGVPVPSTTGQHDLHGWLPLWEDVWSEFVVHAELSIAEAQPPGAGDGDDEHAVEVPEPPGGWTAPRWWWSPFQIFTPRDPNRGFPDWVTDAPAGPLDADTAELCRTSATVLGLTGRPDPWSAYTADYRSGQLRELAEVMPPQTAALLAAAAGDLVEAGIHDLLHYRDRPYERDPDGDDWMDSLLGLLPEVCDRQNAAWRLAMVRAVADVRQDLLQGRAPLPRCHGEEVALYLILVTAQELLDTLDDADIAAMYRLPASSAFSARHQQWDSMREVFYQDEDVLMWYEPGLAHVAADPTSDTARDLHTGDLRPAAWWWTFGNLNPRPAGRGFSPDITAALAQATPPLIAEHTDRARPGDTGAALPDRTEALFERLVGLAQRRFFDKRCAVAMADALADLLQSAIDSPQLTAGRAWRHGRAVVGRDILIVDHDFAIDGLRKTWRLRADMTDHQARAWVLHMLGDCAMKVLDLYGRAAPELLLPFTAEPTPVVDPTPPAALAARIRALGHHTTLAGLLRHLRRGLGITIDQVGDAALLPAAVIIGWEQGTPARPEQLVRCAPALQLPESVLLMAARGHRDSSYWPLPSPGRRRTT